jgi:hypothetical protein
MGGTGDAAGLPLIEPDPHPSVQAPSGYRAYLLREWHRYVVLRAESVQVRDDDLHLPDELVFHYGRGGGVQAARRPKFAGEVSHVFLPDTFSLPEAVRALRAKPIPRALPSFTRQPVSVLFEEETPPAGSPTGAKAYRAVIPGFVFTGTITGISGTPDNGFSFGPGSDVKIRKVRPGDDTVSHVIVPAGHSLPNEFIVRRP